jgi:hypothetical protein
MIFAYRENTKHKAAQLHTSQSGVRKKWMIIETQKNIAAHASVTPNI